MIKINFNLTLLTMVRLEKFSFTDEICARREYFLYFFTIFFQMKRPIYSFSWEKIVKEKMREPTKTLAYGREKPSPPPW